MKSQRNIAWVLLFVFQGFYSVLEAQESVPSSISKAYEHLSYMQSSKKLEGMVKRGIESKEIYQKLGNGYYFNSKMKAASKWYKILFSKYESIDAEYYYRYAMSLKGKGDYTGYKQWMDRFVKSSPNDSRSKRYESNPNYLTGLTSARSNYILEPLELNSKYSDFGAGFYKEGIVFSSSRNTSAKVYSWNDQPYLDLYYSKTGEDSALFSEDLNSKYHESTVSFTANEDTLYFGRNNYNKGRLRKSSKKVNGLKIYRAVKKGKSSWKDIESLPFNSDEYNTSHPALSPDGKQLYFTSDMPGGYGESDLYVVSVHADGSFGSPRNLGESINTEGRENFPYVDANNVLYFSSDGHLGLGGLDVFKVDLKESPLRVENLKRPINSPQDDFNYIEDTTQDVAYVSSNREGGQGDDDIYRVLVQEKEKDCELEVKGQVLSSEKEEALAVSTVRIYNEEKELVQEIETDTQGRFSYLHPCKEAAYTMVVSKGGFKTAEQRIQIGGESNQDLGVVSLTQELEAVGLGEDIGKAIDLLPIYFDYDKWNIREDAELELNKVVDYLKRFPGVKIDVRSHTDSRGTASYNALLSQRRNASTKAYLIRKGIGQERITGKGYGEEQLVNHCSDGMSCTETEHQQNRRSEFIVVK